MSSGNDPASGAADEVATRDSAEGYVGTPRVPPSPSSGAVTGPGPAPLQTQDTLPPLEQDPPPEDPPPFDPFVPPDTNFPPSTGPYAGEPIGDPDPTGGVPDPGGGEPDPVGGEPGQGDGGSGGGSHFDDGSGDPEQTF